MSLINTSVASFKKLLLFILIVAVAIPLWYGSTNRQYLQLRLFHSALSLKHSLLSDAARPTLSADYRAFEEILRMKPIAERDPTADILTIIKEFRKNFAMGTLIPKPSQCQISKEVFKHEGHSVDTYWIDYSPRKFNKNSDKLIIYLHGGGYMMGDIDGYSGIECHLSQLFNVSILHVEYRLIPEHLLPAAVEDTVAIYRALLRHKISPSQLFIMGDSAGGGLSLLTIQAIISHQLPVPRGVIAVSPWTDLSASGESYSRNAVTDVMLSTDDTKWLTSAVLGFDDSKLSFDNPLVSPLFGSFEGFPPMYVTVGTAEILEDDSRQVVKRAQEANVDVVFEEGLHLMHAYPVFFPYFPEARNTLNNINKWIQTIFTDKDNQ